MGKGHLLRRLIRRTGAKSPIMGAVRSRETFMRGLFSAVYLAPLALVLLCSCAAQASEKSQLVASINAYRSQAQRCAWPR